MDAVPVLNKGYGSVLLFRHHSVCRPFKLGLFQSDQLGQEEQKDDSTPEATFRSKVSAS